LEKRPEQFLPGIEGDSGDRERTGGREREIAQSMCAHRNKRKNNNKISK
jgi:hypothetical protein